MATLTMEHEDLVKYLKELLHAGKVTFWYTKKNGETREALGTLKQEIYGEENAPKGTEKKYPDNVIRYYDLNSNGWRSFLEENLQSVDILS